MSDSGPELDSILPSVSDAVVVADFDTELVVLVPERRRAHLLEPMWALLFDSCRSGHRAAQFIDEVGEAMSSSGWNPTQTRAWMDDALGELRSAGLVV